MGLVMIRKWHKSVLIMDGCQADYVTISQLTSLINNVIDLDMLYPVYVHCMFAFQPFVGRLGDSTGTQI